MVCNKEHLSVVTAQIYESPRTALQQAFGVLGSKVGAGKNPKPIVCMAINALSTHFQLNAGALARHTAKCAPRHPAAPDPLQ
jgi:hypothetical protein